MTVADSNNIRKFLWKAGLFISPWLILAVPFFLLDPFKILYKYEDYYSNGEIVLNRDFVTTQIYLKTREQKKYDSFILGNSRSLAFQAQTWKKYLDSATPFHFDSSAESLYGIWKKVNYLQETGAPLRNALIVLDVKTLRQLEESRQHLYIHHPVVAKSSWVNFYSVFVKAYFSDFFWIKYMDYYFFHQYRPYMKGVIQAQKKQIPETNDIVHAEQERQIRADPDKYYKKLKTAFKECRVDRAPSQPVIGNEQRHMLTQIQEVFAQKGTGYKIIINPEYDQVAFFPADLEIVQNIFGEGNVFNYSGVNDITNDMHNYYDTSHYRTIVGERIMDEIYGFVGFMSN